MKTKTITTTKGEFLVLELPVNVDEFGINDCNNTFIYTVETNLYEASGFEKLPDGNWQILGFIADLSEEQKGEIFPLLQANDVLLVNPFGENLFESINANQWLTAKQNTFRNALILKQI